MATAQNELILAIQAQAYVDYKGDKRSTPEAAEYVDAFYGSIIAAGTTWPTSLVAEAAR